MAEFGFRYHWREGRKHGYPVCCILRFGLDMKYGRVAGLGRLCTDRGGYVGCGIFHGLGHNRRRPLICLHRWASHHPLVVQGSEGVGQLNYCPKCERARWVQKGPLPPVDWGRLMMGWLDAE